jgi:hypothetical protein
MSATKKFMGALRPSLIVLAYSRMSLLRSLNFAHHICVKVGKQFCKRRPINALELQSSPKIGETPPVLVLGDEGNRPVAQK